MRKTLIVVLALLLLPLVVAATASAAPQPLRGHDAVGATVVAPKQGAPEIAVRPYEGYVYYSELAPILTSIAKRSNRVSMKQIGLSAFGNPMWLITITDKWQNAAVKKRNMLYRKLLLTDPAKAKKMLTAKSGIRAPVFINASIHGGETTGVDASLQIIRRLAFKNDAQTKRILRNCVVLINPCQNPDGRIVDLRANGNGFDLNRDFITLTQPETLATVKQIRAYKPAVFLDLHGYVNPMLIEPCTIPHNPSLEYDLFIKWALPLAEQMKATLENKTGMTAQIPYLYGTADDKRGDVNEGWDDYGPYYTGMIAQQMGSLGYTLETPYKTVDGVDAHYWTSWSTLNYVVKNRLPIMRDQAEVFRRGDKNVANAKTGRPWTGNMEDMLRPVPWGDPAFPYSNVVGDVEFPYAYIVPVDDADQKDPLQAMKFINHARVYGVEVHRAAAPFTAGTVTMHGATAGPPSFPSGTYVLRTQQPLRSLLNNMLWDGEDVKAQYGVGSMYDISAWSLPESWGFDCYDAEAPFSASLAKVTAKVAKAGKVTGAGPVYQFDGNTNQAVKAVNVMLQRLYTIGMVSSPLTAPYAGVPIGAFVVDTTDTPGAVEHLKRVAAADGVDFVTLPAFDMGDVAVLSRPNVAVNVDAQAVWVLKDVLGFVNVSNVSATPAVTTTNTAYVTTSNSTALLGSVQTWLNGSTANRSRVYIGIDRGGIQAWADGLLPGVIATTYPSNPERRDNGLVMVDYSQDSVYTAGYPESDYAFCYPPAWFEEDLAAVSTDVTYRAGIAGPYFAGFWNNPSAGAVGKAAMVSGIYDGPAASDYGRVVFTGFHPTYRAMEENTYVLLARAIFLSSATAPMP